ncbi:MAG: hypothetical protein JSS72_05465 [Armatimonadetes bacterium]|nr:hypothetical protein [Armatimonadota bacterium]
MKVLFYSGKEISGGLSSLFLAVVLAIFQATVGLPPLTTRQGSIVIGPPILYVLLPLVYSLYSCRSIYSISADERCIRKIDFFGLAKRMILWEEIAASGETFSPTYGRVYRVSTGLVSIDFDSRSDYFDPLVMFVQMHLPPHLRQPMETQPN